MNAFEAADYAELLPRRWKRRLGTAVLAVALLFPTAFQNWYLVQVQDYTQKLAKQLEHIWLPEAAVDKAPG